MGERRHRPAYGAPVQFDLFPPPPLDTAADAALAAKRPAGLFVGTASWTFTGWGGLVYRGRPTQAQLVAAGLEEYARHPLFNTVCIDRSFYAPMSVDELAVYARQLPEGYRCGMKVWQAICDPMSPQFLDAGFFKDAVLAPVDRAFAGHLGPLIFQFPPLRAPPSPNELAWKLDRFFSRLPEGLECAVELRNAELMTPSYFSVLKRRGVAHLFNHWERTPPLHEQLDLPGAFTANHAVARLLLPQGIDYEAARDAFSPFDRLQAIDERLRADVAELWRRCQSTGRTLWCFVGNKAEGCAPLTARAIQERMFGR